MNEASEGRPASRGRRAALKPRRWLAAALLACLVPGSPVVGAAPPEGASWNAGAAQRKITPEGFLWLSGYSARTKPASGKLHDLWVRALALEAPGAKPLALVTLDLVGIDARLSHEIRQRIEERFGLDRSQVVLCTSHTHSGPVVGSNLATMYFLDDAETAKVETYTRWLANQIVETVGEALAARQPCRLSTGRGNCSFAVNRRNNPEDKVPELRAAGQLRGPVDHDVPVLKVETPEGKLVAVAFGYACHATTLDGYEYCGDYPGFACDALAEKYPEAVPLFWAGCGGDANPIPRRKVELARQYGSELAAEVERVLAGEMSQLEPSVETHQERIVPLAFAKLPTREELESTAKSENRYEASRARQLLAELESQGRLSPDYPYPIVYWRLGDRLDWIFLGGEVVVDYALRLKGMLGADAAWVAGYTNDVMAYIPSRRVLDEGGYEGGGAMVYYGLPSPWAGDVEERIISAIRELTEAAKSKASARANNIPQELSAVWAPLRKLDPGAFELPKPIDSRLAIELAVAEPDLVTPTGVAVDPVGRVYVVENHTHFPPADYAVHGHDRIRLFADGDGDGRLDRAAVFHEGSRDTVNLCLRADGWLYVACRAEIFRVRDSDGDSRADERQLIARLVTAGNYPHNGLLGGVFDASGAFIFGLGENLGAPYELVGSDGTTLRGGGEGGSLYRCQPDGSRMERIATGFWNPHQQAIDGAGRLFAIDNDPDSRPPCRLMHIVPQGDYGYRYRNGRRGIHPFTAWNGELPGTLPMAAGTGEAPSGILAYRAEGLPSEYREALLITSWGDHRLERYQPAPHGASVRAVGENFVIGGENFRPVGIAAAPDGSLWVSDWVDKSYDLHGKGRLWHITWREKRDASRPGEPLAASEAEKRAARMRSATAPHDERLAALAEADPYLRQAAQVGLEAEWSIEDWLQLAADADRHRRLAALLALRKSADPKAAAPVAALLADADETIRFAAVQWVGESRLAEHRAALEALLVDPRTSKPLLEGALAALERLDGVTREASSELGGADYLVALADSDKLPRSLLPKLVRMTPPEHVWLSIDRLRGLLAVEDGELRLEAIRSLRESPHADAPAMLREIASDERRPLEERLEALCGVSPATPEGRALLRRLAGEAEMAIRDEAWRAWRHAPIADDDRSALENARPADAGLAELVLGAGDRSTALLAASLSALAEPGDPKRGGRLFFHPRGPRCYRCHEIDGRGGRIGPDLSHCGSMPRERIVAALVDPDAEVGPQFIHWSLQLTDGQTLSGMLETEDPQGNRVYLTPQGERVAVHVSQIETAQMLRSSVMPKNLPELISRQELVDLVAYLESQGK